MTLDVAARTPLPPVSPTQFAAAMRSAAGHSQVAAGLVLVDPKRNATFIRLNMQAAYSSARGVSWAGQPQQAVEAAWRAVDLLGDAQWLSNKYMLSNALMGASRMFERAAQFAVVPPPAAPTA
jgi:hypothetical protein